MLTGRQERAGIDHYYEFENYESNGKKAFYGFHWREYTAPELEHLFSKAGFTVESCKSLTSFQDFKNVGLIRRLARKLSQIGTVLLPRHGTSISLVATK